MSNATHLLLIRHGQSDGNAAGRFGGHGPTPLSELGREQAERTAQVLAKERITAIYTSDLLRAVQTAEPLGKLLNLPMHQREAFRERHVGVLEGLTFDESKKQYPRDYYALINRNVNHVITKGESYRHLLRRITTELRSILRSHERERVAIFSHTGAICFMTLNLMGAINRDTEATPWRDTSDCGINRVEFRRPRNVRVLDLNDTRHLVKVTGNDAFATR